MTRSILLVDADPQVLTLLTRALESRGWHVEQATSAAEATALYERQRPDLVLLALRLPGNAGTTLLELLRSRDPDATLVMLTDPADSALGVQAMEQGAETFLTKPVQPAHLHAAAERAWEKAELRRVTRLHHTAMLPTDTASATLAAATRDADGDVTLEEVERCHILRVLQRHDGNRSRAARILGISRATLYEKLARYNVPVARRSRRRAGSPPDGRGTPA